MPINLIAFSPHEVHLVFGDEAGVLVFWDLKQNKKIAIVDGHKRQVVTLSFSSDGSQLASGGLDHQIKVWDVLHGRELFALHENVEGGCTDRVFAVRFAVRGQTLVSAHLDFRVRIWNLETHSLLTSYELASQIPIEVFAMSLTKDGDMVAAIGRTERIRGLSPSWSVTLWDIPRIQER